jgi:hypothetical protein
MNSQNTIISVADYFAKGKLVVPDYQRGYKWSLMKTGGGKGMTHKLTTGRTNSYDF